MQQRQENAVQQVAAFAIQTGVQAHGASSFCGMGCVGILYRKPSEGLGGPQMDQQETVRLIMHDFDPGLPPAGDGDPVARPGLIVNPPSARNG